ncbi:MAG: YggT family protein [Litorivicinus sp.]
MSQALFSMLSAIAGILVFFLVIRLVLQLVQANYYNPICQGVNRFSAPLLAPTSRLIPDLGPLSLNTLFIAVLVQSVAAYALALSFYSAALSPLMVLLWSLLSITGMVLKVFFFALIIMIILSWVAPQANHPGAELVYQITEPVMAPVRRVMPELGGLDLSPIAVFLLIQFIENAALRPMAAALRVPSQLFFGL